MDNGFRPLRTMDGLSLYAGNYPEPTPIVDRVLFKGVTILAGRPKTGKSWLSLELAVSVARGSGYFLGWLPVRKSGRVMYLALEEREARTHSRLMKISPVEEWMERLEFCYEADPLNAGGAGQIDAKLEETEYALVVIDTLLKMSSPTGADIVKADYKEMNLLHDLAQKHGVAIVVVHHTRKATGDGVDTIIGTSGTTAACDCLWTISRKPEGHYVMSVVGREVQEEEFELVKFSDDNTPWTIVGEGEEVGMSRQRHLILSYLRTNGPSTSSEITKALGGNQSSICQMLDKMAVSGLVDRKGTMGKAVWTVNSQTLTRAHVISPINK